MPTKEQIIETLKTVKYPGYSRDIVAFGLVKEVTVDATAIHVRIGLTGGNAQLAAQLKAEV